ncbi:MAG: aminoacyl-tRNA hydrolase [archaeon]
MALKQAIIVRIDLKMGKGKIAGQCCHASLGAFLKCRKKNPRIAEEWLESGMAKIVLKCGSKSELLELFMKAKQRLPCELIHDAGRTQIEAGETTCLGIGPAEESELDGITGKLKLL